MSEELVEEKEITVEGYLAMFDVDSPDHAILKQRAEKISKIIIKKIRRDDGQNFEDTTFIEKSGVTYTVRARMD